MNMNFTILNKGIYVLGLGMGSTFLVLFILYVLIKLLVKIK